jgi:hypothetical protein
MKGLLEVLAKSGSNPSTKTPSEAPETTLATRISKLPQERPCKPFKTAMRHLLPNPSKLASK